tara:strand:+ start:24251 stop:25318 length:1068 start_codon:yes stop_codon:yes gene_type:complete
MSNIKPITINPDLFKVGGGTKKERPSHNKTQKISTIKNNIQPNKLKRDLLQKIKNYKQKEKNSSENVERKSIQNNSNVESNTEKKGIYKNLDTTENNEFQNEFMKSLNFLQQLSQKGRNKTMKANRPVINIDMPDNLKEKDDIESKLTITNKENGDVPYGCLKNGSKPTFRQWKNYTVKNTSYKEPQLVNLPVKSESINNIQDNKSNIHENTSNNIENNEVSNEINNEIKREVSHVINNSIHQNQNTYYNPNSNNSYISTKTKTIKYHLGKKNRKVSILIKNAATRKKINTEHNKIKRTSVLEMKNYLRKHNLLKAGSEAPNDVIRKLYEQCLLSGNINNTNKDNLLHNYLNDEK